jgi:hypothetical protein
MRIDTNVRVVTGTPEQIDEQLAALEADRKAQVKEASKEEGPVNTR